MHPSLRPLMLALEVAERDRDQAQSTVLQLRHQLETAQAQARQLDAYRHDYQQRWSERFQAQGTVQIMQCYHSFLSRLDQAGSHQEAIVQRMQHHLDQAMEVLREREMRAASIRKLIERRQDDLARARSRQDQKLTDEQAARVAWSGRSASGNGLALA
jgi:flagellar FliJ protein